MASHANVFFGSLRYWPTDGHQTNSSGTWRKCSKGHKHHRQFNRFNAKLVCRLADPSPTDSLYGIPMYSFIVSFCIFGECGNIAVLNIYPTSRSIQPVDVRRDNTLAQLFLKLEPWKPVNHQHTPRPASTCSRCDPSWFEDPLYPYSHHPQDTDWRRRTDCCPFDRHLAQ